MIVEQTLAHVISVSGSICSAAAESPWLVDLHLNCNLSAEVLVGLIVLPIAGVLLALDLLVSWFRARAKRHYFARRLQITRQINSRVKMRDDAEHGQGDGMYPLTSMFPPLRTMRSI